MEIQVTSFDGHTEQLQVHDDSYIAASARLVGDEISIGKNVRIEEDVTIVGKTINLGDNTVIQSNSDIRSSVVDIGANSSFARNSKILVAERFVVGTAARLDPGIEVTCREFIAGNLLYLGHETCFGYGGTRESTATVTIGDRVALGPKNIINCNQPVTLGNQVGTGADVTFWTHGFHFGHSVLEGYSATYEPIIIEDNVWLAFHVTVLPGVKIGRNTIVAAGATVSKSIEADVVAVGSPAKSIKGLAPSQPSTAELKAILSKTLDLWVAELVWKEIQVETNEQYIDVVSDGNVYRLSIEASGAEGSLEIVIDRNDGARTTFDLMTRAVDGPRDPLIEDLRDFLRRHSMPCDDQHLFESITPSLFIELQKR